MALIYLPKLKGLLFGLVKRSGVSMKYVSKTGDNYYF